ncbi:32652_t:CDS:2, partial [Racocetra persica]
EFGEDSKLWINELLDENLQEDFWRDIECRMKDIKSQLMECTNDNETTEMASKYLVDNKFIRRKGSVKYLFAFDEARILSRDFCNIYSIHSNISDFSPVSYHDPSLTISERGVQLFEPFHLLDTVDMNVKEIITLKESEDPHHFFQYGRPLWGALLLPPGEAKGMAPERIIELAMDKLIGGENFSIWKKRAKNNIGILETLAILGPRLCIEISPQSIYMPSLMANNMRLCINVLRSHEYIITEMPTEPLLTEASTRIMNDPYISLTELINQLSSALKNGVVEGGYRGELVARLLLLNAWDC